MKVPYFLDSCAFNPHSPEDQAANEIFRLFEENKIILIIVHSVQKEIDHPNTPDWVKVRAQNMISVEETSFTPDQRKLLSEIEAIIVGDGLPEKYKPDARHIYEAQYYRSCFVTTDQRILKKTSEINSICRLKILLPSDFLERIEGGRVYLLA